MRVCAWYIFSRIYRTFSHPTHIQATCGGSDGASLLSSGTHQVECESVVDILEYVLERVGYFRTVFTADSVCLLRSGTHQVGCESVLEYALEYVMYSRTLHTSDSFYLLSSGTYQVGWESVVDILEYVLERVATSGV